MTDALDAYLLDCTARNLAPVTVARYGRRCEAAIVFLAGRGVTTLEDLRAADLREYVVSLAKRGLRASTQGIIVRVLRSWLNWCEAQGYFTGKNPMRAVKMPKQACELKPAVSLRDVERLLDACEDARDPLRERAIILLLVDTGLRASELCGLTVGDLAGDRLLVHGKGGKDRAVFIGDATRHALAEYLGTRPDAGDGDPLFIVAVIGKLRRDAAGQEIPRNPKGDGFTYQVLRDVLRRLGARAGVNIHNAHAMRRTFAVESLRNGCDLVRLARLMGHSNLTMLERHYLPLLEDDLREAHKRTSPVDRLTP